MKLAIVYSTRARPHMDVEDRLSDHPHLGTGRYYYTCFLTRSHSYRYGTRCRQSWRPHLRLRLGTCVTDMVLVASVQLLLVQERSGVNHRLRRI